MVTLIRIYRVNRNSRRPIRGVVYELNGRRCATFVPRGVENVAAWLRTEFAHMVDSDHKKAARSLEDAIAEIKTRVAQIDDWQWVEGEEYTITRWTRGQHDRLYVDVIANLNGRGKGCAVVIDLRDGEVVQHSWSGARTRRSYGDHLAQTLNIITSTLNI